MKFLLLMLVLPLVELALLVELGRRTSTLAAVGWVLVSGIVGWWLCKSQGLSTYRRIRQQSATGKLPTEALVDGLLILIAGVLLVTPGILTDLFGFSLVVPGSRTFFRNRLIRRMQRHVQQVIFPGNHEPPPNQEDDDLLEGTVVLEEEDQASD
jgi:UPF0716 protein FxsA